MLYTGCRDLIWIIYGVDDLILGLFYSRELFQLISTYGV
jgi:hypothetical protein